MLYFNENNIIHSSGIVIFASVAMSYSKVKKITPVLPPDQRLKLKGVLKDAQLFWNASGSKNLHFESLIML